MRRWVFAVTLCAAVGWLGGAASATQYAVDPDHTTVTFKVRHLFTDVTGRFDKFDGGIEYDPAHPEQTKVKGTIDAASINTNNTKRDTHLRSADFFDVEKFPKITFTSAGITQGDPAKQSGKMEGKLTIHGVERPVVLEVAFLGAGKDPWGNQRAGFSGSTTIDRKDFGLTWNQALETGGFLVGDTVTIELQIEGKVVP